MNAFSAHPSFTPATLSGARAAIAITNLLRRNASRRKIVRCFRAVLRMHPKPGCVSAALCVVDGYDKVLELLRTARRSLGPMLSAFEVMWGDYWHQATECVPGARAPVQIW